MKIIRTTATMLAAILLIALASCTQAAPTIQPAGTSVAETSVSETSAPETSAPEAALPQIWSTALYTENTELGEGEKTLSLTVEADGHSVVFTLHTDAETVGDALLKLQLVEGENGAYGLYIKKVNGMLADYDVDQTYWSFLHGGEYMMTGVDATALNDGDAYELVRAK